MFSVGKASDFIVLNFHQPPPIINGRPLFNGHFAVENISIFMYHEVLYLLLLLFSLIKVLSVFLDINSAELMQKIKSELKFMGNCTQAIFAKVVFNRSQGTMAQLLKANGKGPRFNAFFIKAAKFFNKNSPSERRKLYTACKNTVKKQRAPDQKYKVPVGQRYYFNEEQKKLIRNTYRNSSFTMDTIVEQLVESTKAPEASIRIFIKNDKARNAQNQKAAMM